MTFLAALWHVVSTTLPLWYGRVSLALLLLIGALCWRHAHRRPDIDVSSDEPDWDTRCATASVTPIEPTPIYDEIRHAVDLAFWEIDLTGEDTEA